MFFDIYKIELKKNLKSVSFYIFTTILLLYTYIFASNIDPNMVVAMPIGREWHNAPLVIARYLACLSVYGILITIMMVGRAVTKDFSAKIHDFFFTLPMSKTAYLGGRLFGGLTANLLIFLGAIIGLIAGCLVIDPKYYGSFSLSGFLLPTIIILIPNLLLIGSIFFSLATISRNMVMSYMAGIGLMIVYGFVTWGFTFLENDTIRILADPFAISSLGVFTKYWTVSEINTNPMPLSGMMLLNRGIWLTVSFVILYFTWKKFKFISILEHKKNKTTSISNDIQLKSITYLEPMKASVLDDSFTFQLKKCFHLVGWEFKRIVFHPAFIILTIMAMANIFVNFYANVGIGDDNRYPLTSYFLQQMDFTWVYIIPLIIFFGGVIVWRERDHNSHQFYDTLPLPGWLSYLTKLFALMSIVTFFIIMIMLTGIFTQVVILRWTDIEFGLYLKQSLGIHLIHFWHIAIIVLFIQNLVKNKYLGFFICALYFIADIMIFLVFGYDNILLRYGYVPSIIYSNMNGYGHYAPIILWYTVYWLIFAFILGIISSLLWRRNEETRLKYRIRIALQNLQHSHKIALAVLLILLLATGTTIYYNKYIVNQYLSKDQSIQMQADYEKEYSKFSQVLQPKIEHIKLNVAIFPEQRDVLIKGYYSLRNKTNEAIDTIFVNLPDRKITKINNLEFSQPAELKYRGKEYGFRIYRLETPLNPGEKIVLKFDLEARTVGFTENNPKNELAQNGTCLFLSGGWGSNEYFPGIGYNRLIEIDSNFERKKHGLPERPEFPPLENEQIKWNFSYTTYDAIISTSSSQAIISNGNLIKQWSENDRNYFHYKTDVPMQNEITIVSGEYEVVAAEQDGISVEVYYHKKHPWNIPRIINGMKSSLNYCSSKFCKYPYSTFRIVEIPNYYGFGARSQPSMVVWNENAVFINNIEDPEANDQMFGITAHEITHNWWPYIVTPSFAEGCELTTEAICQYVWIMCLEKEYGKAMARKQLREELDDYLRGRKKDTEGERTLARQFVRYYITYAKSMIAMYTLQDYIGEENVNKALKSIIDKFGHRENSYINSLDLIKAYRQATPDSLQYLITDLFETITLHENQVLSANYETFHTGKYKVSLKVSSRKFRADSDGKQTEIPLDDYIDIGIFGEDDEELYLKKHKFTQNIQQFEIIVDKKPVQAGIDPYLILIDRNREDNLKKVVSKVISN